MIKTIVADDEEIARLHLTRLLEPHKDIQVIAQAANGLEALELVEEMRPRLVFLDVEMPGLNGFEVVSNLTYLPLIVFATAYDAYAVRAFEANAADYLLKPINEERVRQSLARVRAHLNQDRDHYRESLEQLLAGMRQERDTLPLSKLAVRKGKRIVLLPFRQILRISVEDTLVFVYSASERFLSDKTISELEETLVAFNFFRINRSEIINLDCVTEIIPWFNSTFRLKLSDGLEMDVSRERGRRLKALLKL
ncbi:MAG TPA: LytTR family DNA-binding domain-containing protein [Pyrinomonadaceae bacterium]|nr:LytTR family DNA-binding domain-containing protein [Pyrinomonadaceae bacterium]